MIRRRTVCIAVLAVSFLFLTSLVFAQPQPPTGVRASAGASNAPALTQLKAPTGGKIMVGPLEVHPSLAFTETYSDNIYSSYDNKDKESDFITTLSPGLSFVLPMRRHSLEVGYQANINWYADNNETDYTDHLVGGALNLDFPGGLIITLSDYYSIATTPRKWKDQPGITGAADAYRDKESDINDLNAMVRYNFADRWAISARYNNYNVEYDEVYDDGGSYNRDLGGGSIFYRFTAKTEALVEYSYSEVDYDTSNTDDNSNQMAYVGLSFDPTAKLNGYLKLGWTEKDYDQTVAGRDDKLDAFSSLVDLRYNLSSYNQLSLKVTRVIEEDIDTNAAFTRDDVRLGFYHVLAWNEKINLNAHVGYGKEKFEGGAVDVDGITKILSLIHI